MFCKNCGKYVSDSKEECPYCGSKVEKVRTIFSDEAYDYGDSYEDDGDSNSIGWGILGFLIPLVGLILYLVWKEDYPIKAHNAGKGALISVILEVILGIILIACSSCILTSLINQ